MKELADVVAVLRQRIDGRSQKELAASLGISPQYLHDVLNFRRLPGKKLLAALGLRAVTHYEKAEPQ